MLTFSYDEMKKKPNLPKIITCKLCGKKHRIRCAKDKMGIGDSFIQFFKCCNQTYLAGLGWKDIRK